MSNTEVLGVLALAHALIDSGWCQGYLARDRNRRKAYSLDSEARRWCLSGALHLAFNQGEWRDPFYEYQALIRWIVRLLPEQPSPLLSARLVAWNDAKGRRKQDVLALIETAAAEVGK